MKVTKKAEKIGARDRIINETKYLMGKECKLKFTTRDLSKKADVNLASINYYYGSKAALVKRVEEEFYQLVEDVYSELNNNKRKPNENLQIWAEQLVKLLIEYPGIMYIWSYKVIVGKDTSKQFLDLFYSPDNPVTKIISKQLPKEKPEIVNFKSIQLVSDILNPFVFNQNPQGKKYFDMKNEKSRKQYIEYAVESALKA